MNIFTPQQETDYGEIVAEQLQREFRVIDDEQLTAYLANVSNRILQRIPGTPLQFHVYLFDSPVANAFSLPGGRIYVSRKMVAFLRSEDELAGVLGHEMGHILSHQEAVDATRMLREVLGVTSIGNRKDISDKYNQLIERAASKKGAIQEQGRRAEPEQYQADQIALYALASAGYSPQSFLDFWDRFAQTQGKTGGFLSDLFGITKPAERRLREMRKAFDALPAGCKREPSPPLQQFQAWQAQVIGFSNLAHKESLHAVVTRTALEPPLNTSIQYLKFSPDGHYLLAQDESSIYVLTRPPLQIQFRVDAPNAHPAQFSPDSKSLLVDTPGLRVEKWDLADEKRTDVHEVVVQGGCTHSTLSPDGKNLACLNSAFDFSLIDVESGQTFFTKKAFFQPQTPAEFFFWIFATRLELEDFEWVHMGFSPDGRYVIASHRDSALCLDLLSRTLVSLRGSLKDVLSGGFAFLAPDRLIGVWQTNPQKSAVVRFPSGETLETLPIGRQKLAAPGHGNYVLLYPIKDHPVGVVDLVTKRVVVASDMAAMDVYDDLYVREQLNGDLALYQVSTLQLAEKVLLPRSRLGALRVAEVSPDLRWLAISGKSRGGVWQIEDGRRVYNLRGFRGVYFDVDQSVFADFPKFENNNRNIARLDLSTKTDLTGIAVEERLAKEYGRYLVVRKPAKKNQDPYHDFLLEVRDVRNGATLWSTTFPKEVPQVFVQPEEDTMVLMWPLGSASAKDEIKKDRGLQTRLSSIKDQDTAEFLEVLTASTGHPIGRLLVDEGKGSFKVRSAYAAGSWVLIQDNRNRTLLYSISEGVEKGALFGSHSTLSATAGLVCVENEPGHIDLYRLPSLEKADQLIFSSPVSIAQFSADGKRLFVLTANQVGYILDATALGRGSPQAANSR